jgi:hypothetical protein
MSFSPITIGRGGCQEKIQYIVKNMVAGQIQLRKAV